MFSLNHDSISTLRSCEIREKEKSKVTKRKVGILFFDTHSFGV